jgi:hypothetical protein
LEPFCEATSTSDPESVAADYEKIRFAALKRMNLGQFGKE